MVEATLFDLFLSAGFLMSLALRTVIAGILLFVFSRFVGARGGLLAALGVAFLHTVLTIFLLEAYVFPLLEVEVTDILTALKTNIFGLVVGWILPGAVWFFLVMLLLKIGPVQAIILSVLQWLVSLALSYFGVLVFLTEYL